MQPLRKNTGYLASLDGLRGVASLAVVGHHIGGAFDLKHGFHHGYLAVPFFFSLSGYVVAKAYEARLATGAMSVGKFVEIRLVRLLPMIWIATAIAVALGRSWVSAPLALLVLPTLSVSATVFPINPPEWSLFFELAGNFVHAAALRWLRGWRIVAPIVFSAMGLIILTLQHRSLNIGWSLDLFLAGALMFVACYLTGVLIYRLERQGRLRSARLPFVAVLLLFAVMLAFPQAPGTIAFAVRDLFCALVGFPLVIVLCLPIRLGRFEERVCAWLGELSYPLYISHYPIVLFLAHALRGASTGVRYLVAFTAIGLCVAIAASLLTFYDRPLRLRISALIGARQVQPSAGPA